MSAPVLPTPDDDETIHTIEALQDRWGPATEDDATLYVEGTDKALLISRGRRVLTTRIDTDASRLLGRATHFFAVATPEQLDALPALSEHLLRTTVWTCFHAKQTYETREAQRQGTTTSKDARAAEAETIIAKGKSTREQLKTTLLLLAAGSPGLVSKIDDAYGTASEPQELAKALGKLVKLGHDILADTSPGMVKRTKVTRLNDAWLNQAAQLADQVLEAGAAAQAPLASTVTSQANVDYWDGLALTLLGQVIDIFEAGHLADPSIPRLVPIALRSYYSPGSGSKTSRAKKPEGDKPEGDKAEGDKAEGDKPEEKK